MSIGLAGDDMAGILITHEHSDHIRGLGVIWPESTSLPIYGTQRDFGGRSAASSSLGNFDRELLKPIDPDCGFSWWEILRYMPFNIDHDAADPVAYRVAAPEKMRGRGHGHGPF